jgi:hypothetical protein
VAFPAPTVRSFQALLAIVHTGTASDSANRCQIEKPEP